MGIIFGVQKLPGAIATEPELFHLAEATSRFAVDGLSVKAMGRVGMGLQPYYTHARSTLNGEPAYDRQGNLLCFDGRLDNYVDLCVELELDSPTTSDSQIVLAGFLKWGDGCFSRFIGDWALSLWSDKEQSLYLARDHAGTRTLYFCERGGRVLWSTFLETFLRPGEVYPLDREYAARYLGCLPISNLTPYAGIRSVPPSCFLKFKGDQTTCAAHWSWVVKDSVSCSSDDQYEEHFLTLLMQSVSRRIVSGAPVIAELSGGMDSSSIVCVSDFLRTHGSYPGPLLDTISYYDPDEPNWDERPYFGAVEMHRGKAGAHLRVSFLDRTFSLPDSARDQYPLPGADSSSLEYEENLLDLARPFQHRAVLSGIGGDEVLGGIPTSSPELADHLASGDFGTFFARTLEWCAGDQTPFLYSIADTLGFLCHVYVSPRVGSGSAPAWLRWPSGAAQFFFRPERMNNLSFRCHLPPSRISNGLAWWAIMETLPSLRPGLLVRHEYRYPYLDRDLVTFLFSIPREQLVRPGRRRSLMRRALKNIVPPIVLDRRRKAHQSRGPIAAMRQREGTIRALFISPVMADWGLVEPKQLLAAFDRSIRSGSLQHLSELRRAAFLELWLRSSTGHMRGLSDANYRVPIARKILA